MTRSRRIEKREPKWWAILAAFQSAYSLSDEQHDELLEIVINAIHEDKAAEMGSLGGVKGGPARAAAMTSEQRSAPPASQAPPEQNPPASLLPVLNAASAFDEVLGRVQMYGAADHVRDSWRLLKQAILDAHGAPPASQASQGPI